MKKIIDNKVYDTESVGNKLLAEIKDKNGVFERYYRTEKNNCFCHYYSSDGEDIISHSNEEIAAKLSELQSSEIIWDNFEKA